MAKGRSKLAGVSLILALLGIGVGGFSYFLLNTHITESETDSYVLPMARVYYEGSTYTITSGGAYKLFDYTHKSYDTHGAFDLTSDSYTIPETGFYQIYAQYSIYSDVGEFFMIRFYSNDILISTNSVTGSVPTNTLGVGLTDVINVTMGDVLTIKIYHYNPGDLSRNIFSGEQYNFFIITKIA